MWLKNLRHRKLQTIMMFLIIAVCTALLAGAASILTSLDKPSRNFAKTCNAAIIKVFPNYDDASSVYKVGKQFLSIPGVKHVEFARYHAIEENIYLNGKKANLFPDLTEYNDKIFGSDIYFEGDRNASKTLAEDECIIPACISNEYDIHKGDRVTIKLINGNVVYKVAAVYTDPYETSTAFDCDILVKKLPAIGSSINLYIYANNHVTGKQIEENYRESHDGIINGYIFTLEKRTDNSLIVGRIIGALFLAVGIIMLLVSALMIHYMIRNAMIMDAKSIAVFKTIGYTSNEILFQYMKLYFIIITLACMVGMIGSVFISNTILTTIFRNMGQQEASNSVISGILCYLIIASFVEIVIFIDIVKAKRVKPVITLNGLNYGETKKKKQYKGNSTLQFSAAGIAYRKFVREKISALNIIITCIVTIFSINFIMISLDVANTMKENNDYWIGVDKSDVMINVTDPSDYKSVKDIVVSDNRTDYYLNNDMDIDLSLKWKKGMNNPQFYAFVYDDYQKANLPVVEGRNPDADNEIALSTTMASELHKNIGDYIEVYLDENKKADFLITGFFQSYEHLGSVCRLTASAFSKQHMKMNYKNISVYLKNSKDMDNFIRDMKKKIGGKGNVIKRTDKCESVMNMIAKPQQKAIPPVAALVMIIAGLNIFCIVYLKNIQSHRINGIYKCIGYTTWHLVLSNLYYVGALAMVSVIITLPVSLVTYSPIMRLSLSMFNFRNYPMQVNMGHLIIANMIVILIFIVSTLVSSRELFKVNTRDLIQE